LGCACKNGHIAKGHIEAVQAWMQDHNKIHCRMCGLCVDRRFGVHPTCRPHGRAAMDRGGTGNTNSTDDEDPPLQDGSSNLPSLTSIMARRVPVLKHVPKSCRHAWGQALTRALARASTYNIMEAWTELIMLPKAVLLAPPRKGKKHKENGGLHPGQAMPVGGGRARNFMGRPPSPTVKAPQVAEQRRTCEACRGPLP
jgi:hypothetical protein